MTDDWRDEAATGLVSIVPLFGPLMADPARRLVRRVREEHSRNQSRALRAAEVTSGLSREDLVARIAENPGLVPILTRVLFAAGMTSQDEVLDALGAAMGVAASDPDQADEIEFLLIGIQDLRLQHIMMLRAASGPPRWWESPEDAADATSARITTEVESSTWNVEALAEAAGLPIETAYIAVSGLANAGFVRAFNALGGMGYLVTELGTTLLDVLEQHARASP